MAIDCMEIAFAHLGEGKAQMPQRIALNMPDRDASHLTMPCFVEAPAKVLSVKVVTVFPQNSELGKETTQGVLLLHSAETGEILSIMNAEVLTARRTGATSALATRLLAPKDASTMTIFGAGGQARSQIEAMVEVRPIKTVAVHSRDQSRGEAFCHWISDRFRVEAAWSANRQAAVEASAIICTATNSNEPVLFGEWLQEGQHINAIGAYRPDMKELDRLAVQRSCVFVDYLPAALAGAGDLIQAADEGALDWAEVSELHNVLLSDAGRQDPQEVTLFKSVGVAVQDAVVAQRVYEEAVKQGVGSRVDI